MARRFVPASSQYLSRNDSIFTSLPFTFECLAKQNADVTSSLVHIGQDSDITRRIGITFTSSDFGTAATADYLLEGTNGEIKGGTYTLGQWHHVCGVFVSTSNRSIFLDGGEKETSTVNVSGSLAGLNRSAVGARLNIGAFGAFASADIAWVCFRNIALTDEEVSAAAASRDPFSVRPESIIEFFPLWGDESPEPGRVLGLQLTLNGGPAKADHPWIREQSSGLWLPQAVSEPPIGDTVAPDNSHHGHTSTEVTILTLQAVAPDDSWHEQHAEEATVSQEHLVAPDNSRHAQWSDEATLLQANSVAPDDAWHAHHSTQAGLVAGAVVSPDDSWHVHASTEATIAQAGTVSPEDSWHAQHSTEDGVTTVHIVAPDDSWHQQWSTEVTVSQDVPSPIVVPNVAWQHWGPMLLLMDEGGGVIPLVAPGGRFIPLRGSTGTLYIRVRGDQLSDFPALRG